MTNYQIVLDNIIKENLKNRERLTLLLHSCCAPCSSYVLEYLSKYFDITVFYYNPNISSIEEYEKRKSEQERFIKKCPFAKAVEFVAGKYDNENYEKIIEGLEHEKEGEIRCYKCYYMRLEEAAKYAKANNFAYFSTTLSISPHKNSQVLNSIGEEISQLYGIKYLYSDFKKNNGYKRSIELSREYNLYRQNYCGCKYSKPKDDNYTV